MIKYYLSKYTAVSDVKIEPRDLYAYAHNNGVVSEMWTFYDLESAMAALADFESVCIKKGDVYEVSCYALESV